MFPFFFFFRPKPKFRAGILVRHESEHHPNCRYMLITKRRFAYPTGGTGKQWVYDGRLFRIRAPRPGEEELRYVTKRLSVPEKDLDFIPRSK